MNDITYCNGDGCEIRQQCWRYVLFTKNTSEYVWMTIPHYDNETKQCENFLTL